MKIDLLKNEISLVNEFGNNKKHLPLSTKFNEIEILTDGRLLVCEDYFGFNHSSKSNLYCLNKNLDIEWFLPMPDLSSENDLYVGFTSWGDRIFANSWDCYRVEVDINSGILKSVEFTK
jgi:hypothetical protein